MDKIICLCGYKGKSFFPSKLIKWITWGDYSHVAIMLPDEAGLVYEAWDSVGVRRVNSLSDRHSDGTVVDVKYIKVSEEAYKDIIWALISQLGKKYDFRGVFRFPPILRLFVKEASSTAEQEKWFCSEYGCWAFSKSKVTIQEKPFNRISPSDAMASPATTYFDSFICGISDYANLLERIRKV